MQSLRDLQVEFKVFDCLAGFNDFSICFAFQFCDLCPRDLIVSQTLNLRKRLQPGDLGKVGIPGNESQVRIFPEDAIKTNRLVSHESVTALIRPFMSEFRRQSQKKLHMNFNHMQSIFLSKRRQTKLASAQKYVKLS
ncbi:hypothetical protein TG4357_00098 [Thalassovita gelatinovora]|uniref:Uncharacterized protein n=1 Tax=Thalassovita gelatinovora TaxID=53501 RepID=A0A0P1F485_THAGE|nr:hypothetical protein [Thalassovita gelatinovora]CUH62427.1 hypothetical protein TG4357_00098 [Thalassovita gelatinovora]SER17843.1 hypothetical protein SAMN04488043_1194 [Thalassovita gelatinovora]